MTHTNPSSPTPGPSDSSDTGSDLIGATTPRGDLDLSEELPEADVNPGLRGSTDRSGTGERMAAEGDEIPEAADIGFDRVVSAEEVGLGAGLDQAEEARLGITDEEIHSLSSRN